ncbi:hypothetical protein HPB48_022233 [Haemaphysalis longicornis]|uniref:ARF7 effector protein C-terminal domain-containing protein n=1 Tax=Haemaphysalis longicornis TaxID=44386 RepID=A0A9J6FVS0_HAELO|nr:hypothetical protein HPB48_022233 [Haemaphysalis longicornis]
MAASRNAAKALDIDKEDPDSWCTVGLLTNTECHQSILTDESGIQSFSNLPAYEQHSIAAQLGTGALRTICCHHQKFYLYTERHKRGCLDRFRLHGSESAPTGLVKVTSLLVESCHDVVTLEEGERLCQLCVEEIKKRQGSSRDGTSKGNSFASVLASKKYQERAKRMTDVVARCSVGIMTRSLCHITSEPFEDYIKAFSALPRSTAEILVSSLGRAFENICTYHENLYLQGYGEPCFDPQNKHSKLGSSSSKWLVPRQFALACRGKYLIKPGRTVCLQCLKGFCNKYPEIEAFYNEDERATRDKLATTTEGAEKEGNAEHQPGSDAENASMKEESRSAVEYDRLRMRKRKKSNLTAVERELRNLRVDDPHLNDFLGSGHREKRKVKKKTKDVTGMSADRSTALYTDRGIHIASNKDACDCLQVDCPGCHFPCAKCGSAKCGVGCRRNRNWVYEQLEIDGVPNTVYKNPHLK